MESKSLCDYLKESQDPQHTEQINEFFVEVITFSALAFACKPLIEKSPGFFKTIGSGLGSIFKGIGSFFGWGSGKKDDKDEKEKDNKKDGKPTNTPPPAGCMRDG